MEVFRGQLVSHQSGHTTYVTMHIDDGWVRVFNDYKRHGTWKPEDLEVERLTVFRFQLKLDGVVHTFTPDDPNGFSDAVGAVIDLRPKTRFGLGEKVKAALAEQAAARKS